MSVLLGNDIEDSDNEGSDFLLRQKKVKTPIYKGADLSFIQYLQPLSIKQPHDPHEHDSQHIHFVPWLNSLALQGKASGASLHHYHYTIITTTASTTRL
ncbi:hypothetical protein E2C01_091885 [Portunus trituberculatus]|uniref:Uncharacterized protein n=1 Tax=Portunus trituberculatus TaxID=210409 RepID=A0A5B7JQL2_PORTR|nr:hypothetical protein [Portunus trituberculatus]